MRQAACSFRTLTDSPGCATTLEYLHSVLSTCARSDDPGLGQGNLSARRRYDDSGRAAFRRFVHSVDVTRAGWQIPFVTSVVNTYAIWRAEFAAEVCPIFSKLPISQNYSGPLTSVLSRVTLSAGHCPPDRGPSRRPATRHAVSRFFLVRSLLMSSGLSRAICWQMQLKKTWAEEIADVDDGPVFWLALAATQWEYGRLDTSVKSKALKVIEKNKDDHRWVGTRSRN